MPFGIKKFVKKATKKAARKTTRSVRKATSGAHKSVSTAARSVTRQRGPSFRKVVKAAKKVNPFGAFRKITQTLKKSTSKAKQTSRRRPRR